MGFTKEMAQQNQAIYARATELLPAAGWTAETEKTKRGYIAEVEMDRRQRVIDALAKEFPDVKEERIMHQVNSFMSRERGRVWREKQQ